MLPYEELIRTEEYWQDYLENFAWRCAINSQAEINKEIKDLVAKIIEIQKPYVKKINNDKQFKLWEI